MRLKGRKLNSVLGIVVGCALIAGVCSCSSLRGDTKPQIPASDVRTPDITNAYTAAVLQTALKERQQVLASALEQVPDSGAGIALLYDVFERTPTGEVAVDRNGDPIVGHVGAVAKVNSLQNLQSMSEVGDLSLGILRKQTAQAGTNQMYSVPIPDGLTLDVKALKSATATSNLAGIIEARAREKAAIIQGWTALIEAEWSGKNRNWEILGENIVKIIDVTGREIIGRVIKVHPVNAAASVIEAVVQKFDGTTETVTVAKPAVVTAPLEPPEPVK